MLAAAGIARVFFAVHVPAKVILPAALSIALYNLGFAVYLRRIKGAYIVAVDLPKKAARFTMLQAAADLVFLVFLIHRLGGIENPFIFYFIFHTVLAGLLLGKRASHLQALFVVLAVGMLMLLEYFSFIPHHHLEGFTEAELYADAGYAAAFYLVFSSAIFFTAHITASISEKLREKEAEIEEKSLALEKANASLLEKDRLKSEYVRMVAHDIKSPLSSLLSLLSVATGGYLGALPEKVMDVLKRALAKAEGLHAYTGDLLDLSKIRSEKALEAEPLDVRALLDETMRITAPLGEGKNLDIKIEIEEGLPSVFAGREEILHLLKNLIENAIKYTPPGGSVKIKGEREDDTFCLTVSDTGIGIPREDLPRIFDEFYRGSNVRETSRGTGLGLTLVKFIVERRSGSIKVDSEPGRGTAFLIKLPLKR